jgi:uncharacterized membrane protein
MVKSGVVLLLLLSIAFLLVHSFHRSSSSRFIWVAVYALLAGIALFSLFVDKAYALYLPPIMINVSLALLFGLTLQGEGEPLITRIMRIIHGGVLSPELVGLGRRFTVMWVLFFIVLTIFFLTLVFFASISTWSFFANVMNYVFLVVLFLSQFIYGYLRYKNHGAMHPRKALVGFFKKSSAKNFLSVVHTSVRQDRE